MEEPFVDTEKFQREANSILNSNDPRALLENLVVFLKNERDFTPSQIQQIQESFQICVEYNHLKKQRFETDESGNPLPYITHDLETAIYAAVLGYDTDTISTAMLHDVADLLKTEDERRKAYAGIEQRINSTVMKLVRGCTDIFTDIPLKDLSKKAVLDHVFPDAYQDPRLMIVKGCDRLSNLRSLRSYAMVKGKAAASRIMGQSLFYYLPMVKVLDVTLGSLLKKNIDLLKQDFPPVSDNSLLLEFNVIRRKKRSRIEGYDNKQAVGERDVYRQAYLAHLGISMIARGYYQLSERNENLVDILAEFPNLPGASERIIAARNASYNFEDAYIKYCVRRSDEEWLKFHFTPSGSDSKKHIIVDKNVLTFLPETIQSMCSSDKIDATLLLRYCFQDHNLQFRIISTQNEKYFYISYDPLNGNIEREVQGLNAFIGFNDQHDYKLNLAVFGQRDNDTNAPYLKLIYANPKRKIPYLVVDINLSNS